jgi:serine phosphatase RsbU (regulator of sigma subunit)
LVGGPPQDRHAAADPLSAMTSGPNDVAMRRARDGVTPEAGHSRAVQEALEARSRSRNTVAGGLVFALLGAVAVVTLHRAIPIVAVICGVATVVNVAMALLAHRTGRYVTPAAVMGITGLATIALSNFLGPGGPAAAFEPVDVMLFAVLPQLVMYLLGAPSGVAMGSATLTYISVAYAWLMLYPERARQPVPPLLTLTYVFGVATIVVSFVVSLLYVRTRTRMVVELNAAHTTVDAMRLLEQRRLEEELELAARVQTALLPRDLGVEGLEIAASMLPATEVGGDYYDVIPFEHGAWLCIGDVAGHGLNAGLVMLMMQSAVSALAKDDPLRAPDRALSALNATLYDNIRLRLRRDEHATLTLLRYQRDGTVLFAGAHEELLVFRAADGRCEAIATPGPWLGAMPDIARFASTRRLNLGDGDVLVLYTDGLTEARDGGQRQFGLERVEAELLRTADEPVETIRRALLAAVRAFSAVLDDDVTLLVARYRAPASA